MRAAKIDFCVAVEKHLTLPPHTLIAIRYVVDAAPSAVQFRIGVATAIGEHEEGLRYG